MFYQICKILLWIPLQLLHPSILFGRKNMPKGKAIVALNHRSNWDYVMFGLNTWRKNVVMAKKELFKNKPFAAILKNFGGVPIDRDKNDINAIKICMKALKEEKHLVIFPEGTRLKDECQILGEIKSGLAMIAIKTKTPIVPVWINKKSKLFRLVKIYIGKPFELTEFYDQKLDEETLEKASEVVRAKFLELRGQHLTKKQKKEEVK